MKITKFAFIFRFYDNLIKKIFLEEFKKKEFFLYRNFEKKSSSKSLKFVAFSLKNRAFVAFLEKFVICSFLAFLFFS